MKKDRRLSYIDTDPRVSALLLIAPREHWAFYDLLEVISRRLNFVA